eukprot:646457-Rhodomonas_salina.1
MLLTRKPPETDSDSEARTGGQGHPGPAQCQIELSRSRSRCIRVTLVTCHKPSQTPSVYRVRHAIDGFVVAYHTRRPVAVEMSKAKIKVPSPPATAKKAGKEPPSPFPPPENGLPDGLTSEWMTGALRHHGHITDKTTLKISRVGDIYNFNGVVFRVQVSYHGTQAGLPTSFVLKMAPNNPASARREVLFYNSLLPAKPLNENLQ